MLVYIDDMQVNPEMNKPGLSLFELESMIQYNDVAMVQVFTDKNPAALVGSMEGYPMLMITTVLGTGPRSGVKNMNFGYLDLAGLQTPTEFYSPKYETAVQRNTNRPDLRTTIYWNPDLTTDEQGNASFEFYTADAATTYSVVIEGVTNEGKIIRAVKKIRRE
jgi:hypothetical protein